VRVQEIAPPVLAPGEVRIRIEAALTCGTDLKVFKRGYHAKMIVPPAVFGHELAGTISELRTPNSELRTGDRVVVANSAPCGGCFFCNHHQENLCEYLLFLNGAYAESIVVPARLVQKNLLRLKPETDFRDAALTEPLACVVQGVEDLKLRAGQNVLVLGAGPIGLMFVALAKKLGCIVTVAGRRAARLGDPARRALADALDASIADMNAAFAAHDVQRYYRENLSFHWAIVEAAGNQALADTYRGVVQKLHLSRLKNLSQDMGMRASIAEHVAIARALRDGDVARCERRMARHVGDAYTRLSGLTG